MFSCCTFSIILNIRVFEKQRLRCFVHGKLCSETETVIANNLFNTDSLHELKFIIIIFHMLVAYRIISLNKLIIYFKPMIN